jgi:DNA-binding response OmpR family regulator
LTIYLPSLNIIISNTLFAYFLAGFTMHIFLVEDDLGLGASLSKALKTAGHTTEWIRNLKGAAQLVDPDRHDCILLDLNLPDGNGFDLLQKWRSRGIAIPLLVITANESVVDRLSGFDAGADDFLVKPFVVDELIARIHAVTRRAAKQSAEEWVIGELYINQKKRQCKLSGKIIILSPREFDILTALARQQGQVLVKHRLAQVLAPLGDAVDFATLDVHIHNIRRKLGTQWIRTVRGVGYVLENPAGFGNDNQ